MPVALAFWVCMSTSKQPAGCGVKAGQGSAGPARTHGLPAQIWRRHEAAKCRFRFPVARTALARTSYFSETLPIETMADVADALSGTAGRAGASS